MHIVKARMHPPDAAVAAVADVKRYCNAPAAQYTIVPSLEMAVVAPDIDVRFDCVTVDALALILATTQSNQCRYA